MFREVGTHALHYVSHLSPLFWKSDAIQHAFCGDGRMDLEATR